MTESGVSGKSFSKRDLARRQYGQYDLENNTTLLSAMVDWPMRLANALDVDTGDNTHLDALLDRHFSELSYGRVGGLSVCG